MKKLILIIVICLALVGIAGIVVKLAVPAKIVSNQGGTVTSSSENTPVTPVDEPIDVNNLPPLALGGFDSGDVLGDGYYTVVTCESKYVTPILNTLEFSTDVNTSDYNEGCVLYSGYVKDTGMSSSPLITAYKRADNDYVIYFQETLIFDGSNWIFDQNDLAGALGSYAFVIDNAVEVANGKLLDKTFWGYGLTMLPISTGVTYSRENLTNECFEFVFSNTSRDYVHAIVKALPYTMDGDNVIFVLGKYDEVGSTNNNFLVANKIYNDSTGDYVYLLLMSNLTDPIPSVVWISDDYDSYSAGWQMSTLTSTSLNDRQITFHDFAYAEYWNGSLVGLKINNN